MDRPNEEIVTLREPTSVERKVMKNRDASQNCASSSPPVSHPSADQKPRKLTKGLEPFDKTDLEEMEKLLGEVNGHLGPSPI